MSMVMNRYLYTIRILHDQYECVRSVDLAHHLGVSKPTVSKIVRQLQKKGFIEVEKDGNLSLTVTGKPQAEQLKNRVYFFLRLLTEAGVEPSQALQDAIAFSWEMSEASYEAFRTMSARSP